MGFSWFKKSCNCEDDLGELLNTSPFKEKNEDLQERGCLSDDPKCGPCNNGSIQGLYNLNTSWERSKRKTNPTITICSDDNVPRGDVEEVLRHEMQHANLQCGEPICKADNQDGISCCSKILCHEMKAYFCESNKNGWTWDELADQAYESMKNKRNCKAYSESSIKKNAKCKGPIPNHKRNCYIDFPKFQ